MKIILKILKLFGIVIFTVSVLLFSASFFLEDRVGDIILESLNKNISTKLSAASFKLSFLRKFPKASLELKDVLVHSSPDFNSDAFIGINTDTLMAARFLSVEFKISDIIKGIYNIESIGARYGKVNLYSDSAGLVNYDISVSNESPEKEIFTIDLERINLTDIRACYYNLATSLSINGIIENGRLKSKISGNDIDFNAEAAILIDSVKLYNTSIKKSIAADIDLDLQSSVSGILFKKGTLQIENYDFALDGTVTSDNILDLNITGNNLDLAKIRNYLPDEYLRIVADYNPSGILIVKSSIKGLLSRTTNPHIEISCILNEGHITYGKSALSINNLSFSGVFSNGSHNLPVSSFFSIKELKAKLGSSYYSGSFEFHNFDNPEAELILNGKVFPGEIKDFFALDKISTATGSFDLKLELRGNLIKKGKYTFSDIIDMKPEATLLFNSLSFGLDKDKILFNQINGNVLVSNTVRANRLQFIYKGQSIKLDGEFRNLPEWLAGKAVDLHVSADVAFNKLIPEAFFNSTPATDNSTLKRTAINMPGDLFLDINFRIDSLKYKSISSSRIEGALNYKPKLLTFKTLKMESLSGVIFGNGFIVQDIAKSVIARANFNVTNIDVNETFISFKNFGQDFLKAENLAGKLSGSFSILLPMDSLLNPQIKTVTAEGKYILVKGVLKNFEPVKQLSKFIELSELENISFEKLENDFFIKDNFLYVPQMDVKSSAADLSVNGKHSFNNDYEYHVRILLSEILSRKRKRSKSNVSEFGVIQDDGLGRTSLLLKIENDGEDVKVGYDVKAATNVVKTNIKSERQTLKTILNQEYGWFKGDTTVKQKPAENKPRFRITWDESDSTDVVADTTAVKKEGILKNLLKKR